MKLEGYRRLEAHIPTDLWDEVEKARGQITRSEFTRQALRAQLDYPSMLASPEAGDIEKRRAWLKGPAVSTTAATTTVYPEVVPTKKAATVKTAREILSERTRLMRGNNS